MNTLLITDLDNTLYNWVDYFGRCFRGMTHTICSEMEIEETEFIAGAKQVFKKAGTLEYAFLIQELPFISRYSESKINSFIETSKRTFHIIRSKNLKLYDGVLQTFRYLHSIGITIIAVTSAPIYFGEWRLKKLGIDKYVQGILGWEGNDIPQNKFTEQIRKNIARDVYRSKHIRYRWAESKENIKPNPASYLRVIDQFKVHCKNTYVIGDSLGKDIVPAIEIGARSVWAKYGTSFEKKNFETLMTINCWEDAEVRKQYGEHGITPEFTIQHIAELREIICNP